MKTRTRPTRILISDSLLRSAGRLYFYAGALGVSYSIGNISLAPGVNDRRSRQFRSQSLPMKHRGTSFRVRRCSGSECYLRLSPKQAAASNEAAARKSLLLMAGSVLGMTVDAIVEGPGSCCSHGVDECRSSLILLRVIHVRVGQGESATRGLQKTRLVDHRPTHQSKYGIPSRPYNGTNFRSPP
ncbi:hypothetical protein OG21DRAFT_1136136 [Imleria badia]|nr:hypothetical protein OG21DRAFT_1136136 [Imleria badia]